MWNGSSSEVVAAGTRPMRVVCGASQFVSMNESKLAEVPSGASESSMVSTSMPASSARCASLAHAAGSCGAKPPTASAPACQPAPLAASPIENLLVTVMLLVVRFVRAGGLRGPGNVEIGARNRLHECPRVCLGWVVEHLGGVPGFDHLALSQYSHSVGEFAHDA